MDAVLVVLIMAVILLGPLALIVWACVRAYRNRHRALQASVAMRPTSPDAAARLLTEITPLMGEWGYRLSSQGDAGIVFSKTYRPVWLIAPCILLFPIGLLSLIYSRTVNVSFSLLTRPDGGDDVVVSGLAPSRLGGEIVKRLSGSAPK
jgi:hypothetical protein